MASFFLCDTKLSLGLASANPLGKSSANEQEKEDNSHHLLDLNLAPGEQSPGKNSLSDDWEMNNENSGSRKKLRLSNEQSTVLEECFKQNSILNFEQKNSLASKLNLNPRQVEVWFQNRRARTKLKLTEANCKHWKKSYDEMAEENERLKQELEMVKFHAAKRAKLEFCPNCHHNLSMINNYMSIGDKRPAILKPTPKYGGVKIPRI